MTFVQPDRTDSNLPGHIAIIMDGNGRWATARTLGRLEGHQKGAEAVRETVKAAWDMGIGYLTLFAFSSENWSRPKKEVNHLMGLFRIYIRKELAELDEKGVQIRIIGDRNMLPIDIKELAEHAEYVTKNNSRLILTIALSYGSRAEITNAVRDIARKIEAGQIAADEINQDMISDHLQTGDIPEPDLVIRTSGEKRLSNFLLWQSAYAELVFIDVLWPDFNRSHLEAALDDYCNRERRFGAISG
jgi:undecaprenyl diphosphate synthase